MKNRWRIRKFRESIPDWIDEAAISELGEELWTKEIAALNKQAEVILRTNTLNTTKEALQKELREESQIDVYFATFAKSMASTGAFIASDTMIIDYLKYNLRSQMFAKSLQMQLVVGVLKRLDMLRTMPELRTKLWSNVKALQGGLNKQNFDLGNTITRHYSCSWIGYF